MPPAPANPTVSQGNTNHLHCHPFPPHTPPQEGDEEDEETMDVLSSDFARAEHLRDRLVPRAVLFFTGEALEDDDFEVSCQLQHGACECVCVCVCVCRGRKGRRRRRRMQRMMTTTLRETYVSLVRFAERVRFVSLFSCRTRSQSASNSRQQQLTSLLLGHPFSLLIIN